MADPILDNNIEVQNLKTVSLRAPAKVNLSLVVHERQADGFHQLETVMTTIGLADDLTFQLADEAGIHINVTGKDCPAGNDNLVWQTVEALARHAGIEAAVKIELHKRIPLGGGLGGASSNAAACLMGMNKLWGLELSQYQMWQFAAKLGSDVPFFLWPPVGYCYGRGEIVRPLSANCQRSLLLIFPKVHVSTADVFRRYKYDAAESAALSQQANQLIDSEDLDQLVSLGINNLATSCFGQFKELGTLKETIEAMGLKQVCLTGSGATLFATFKDQNEATQWAEKIKLKTNADTLVTHFETHQEHYQETSHANLRNSCKAG